jgi:glutathione S-transferase
MRLYHHPFSPNARRAVMAALQLEADVELVVVDLPKGEQRKPEYLAMNPNGRVPVLKDGDFHLWESHAIMQYLADKTPGQTLYPQELEARADVTRWLFWNAHHFQPSCGVLAFENLVKKLVGGGDPDPHELARGDKMVKLYAGVLDGHLAGKEWIAQGRLTLADLAVATPLQFALPAKYPIGDLKNLQAWFARVQDLDVWKKTALPAAPGH